MNNSLPHLAERIATLSKDPGFLAELHQVRAKSLLEEVAEEIPSHKWTYIVNRVVRNLTAISWGVETLFVSDNKYVEQLGHETRQLALTWESLAKLGEGTSRRGALLNAAIAYELAGYQASAACLARRLNRQITDQTVLTFQDLVGLFLVRHLLYLRQIWSTAWSTSLPAIETATDELVVAADSLAGQGLQQVVQYLMRGDRSAFEKGQNLLEQSELLYEATGLASQTNTVRGIRSTLPQILQRSTWSWFGPQVLSSGIWERYLKLLARGIGSHLLGSKSVCELWPSQQTALQSGLLDIQQSFVIRMPTSAGKTRIAEMAMVSTLVDDPGCRCIYVAPYKALVWEIEDALGAVFSNLGYRVSSIIGSYETDEFEDYLLRNTHVLIATPEKFDLVKRAQPEFLDNVRLVILDEGQIVDDRTRGAKFELLLTRLRRRLPNARFLFISAVMSQQTLEDFAAWIGGGHERIITSDWRPSIQRIAKFQWQGHTGTIRYSAEEDISGLHEFVSGVIRKRDYTFTNPKTLRTNRATFPGSSRVDTAAELAIRFSQLGAVLVFCTQPSYTESVANAMLRAFSLRALVGDSLPQWATSNLPTRSSTIAREWLGHNHPVTIALQHGIAVHHGDLPEILRKAVEQDFRANRYQLIVATNTLAQGVNLPVRTVVVHTCRRYNALTQTSDRIPARDYWNIAGRAGRAGFETDGTIVHIVFNNRDEADFKFYSDKANIEPIRGALFRMLDDLCKQRISEETLRADLDPEVLAILVEEGITSPEREHFEEILGRSLVQVQALRDGLELTPLADAMLHAARETLSITTNEDLLRSFATTGLSSNSCESIRQKVESIEGSQIADLFTKAGVDDLSQLTEFFLDCCIDLAEMQPDHDFGGDYTELLTAWMQVEPFEVLAERFGTQAGSAQSLARFIEEFFAYRLPWGISACITITSAVLDIEMSQISEFVRYFPSMTKYGLVDPKACWLMSIGIPSRQIASVMAATFQAETFDSDYESFLQWLAGLDEDRLRDEFDLSGPIFEDVGRAVYRSRVNPLLSDFPDGRSILPKEVEVKGICFENRSVAALKVRPGDEIRLVRDYDNPVDSNAIKVIHHSGMLGFVPRDIAQVLAIEMDTGLELEAHCTAIIPGRVPKITIMITERVDK